MDFGQRISIHRGTFSAGGWWWYVGAVLVLAGGLRIAQSPPVKTASDHALLLGIATIVIGLLCLVAPVLRWRQTVEVYERGFVWSRLYGTLRVPREDVRAARWELHRSRSVSYNEVEIELAGGRTCSITGIDNPEQLTSLLNAWFAREANLPAPGGWAPPANDSRSGWSGGFKPPHV